MCGVLQLSGNLDNWPHLKELLQSYKADWVKDDSKYGQYEAVSPPVFEPQVFEGPDTDVETGNSKSPETHLDVFKRTNVVVLICENFLKFVYSYMMNSIHCINRAIPCKPGAGK